MQLRLKRAFGVLAASLLSSAAAVHASPRHLSKADYEAIAAAILQTETQSTEPHRTIFVGFNEIDAQEIVPQLQRRFGSAKMIKGSGRDWGTNAKDGCHFDKASGGPAIGIFISAPHLGEAGQVTFQVFFNTCAATSHMNSYTFLQQDGRWKLLSIKHGPVS